jgi:L-asparagine transporter-like permease
MEDLVGQTSYLLKLCMYVGILVPFLSLFLPHRIFLYVTNTRQYKYLKVLIVLPVDEYKPPPLPFPLSSSSYSHSSINLSTMSLYQEMLNLPGYIKYTILVLLLLQGSAFAVWIYMVRGEVQNDNRLKTSKKMD